MPPDQLPKELPFKWRQLTPITVTPAAFAQLVLEDKLVVIKAGGYSWAAKKTDDGYDLYRVFDSWDGVSISTGATADPGNQGQHATITVPAGKRWLFLGGDFAITTSADVADRSVGIQFKADGTNTSIGAYHATPLTASLAVQHVAFNSGGSNGGVVGSGLFLTIGMGSVELKAGSLINTSVLNMQATDNSAVFYYTYKEVSV